MLYNIDIIKEYKVKEDTSILNIKLITVKAMPPNSYSVCIGGDTSNSVIISHNNYSSLHSYDYTPTYQFYGKNNPLYLGFELEIDLGEPDQNYIRYKAVLADWITEYSKQHNAPLYIKYDGSLQAGLEIVSMPCTLEYHLNLQSFYEDLFSILINLGFRSHDTNTCGLHIHINRTYFHKTNKLKQDIEILKLLTLVDKFYSTIEIIARRKSNKYSRKHTKRPNEGAADLYHEARSIGKYSCVNLEHKDTIEFRMFKGTLKVETFISTLEFVSVLAKVAKNTSTDDIDSVQWSDLEEHFSPALKAYVEDRINRQSSNYVHQSATTPRRYVNDSERQTRFTGERPTTTYTDDVSFVPTSDNESGHGISESRSSLLHANIITSIPSRACGRRATNNYIIDGSGISDNTLQMAQRIIDNLEIRNSTSRTSYPLLHNLLSQISRTFETNIPLNTLNHSGSYPLANAHYFADDGELLIEEDGKYISGILNPETAELVHVRTLSAKKYKKIKHRYHPITDIQHKKAAYVYVLRGADWKWIYNILIDPHSSNNRFMNLFNKDLQHNNKMHSSLKEQIKKLRERIRLYTNPP